eukprot:CAMPEP_0115867370 /NCGR_PEP_ID=MMETSP0287-20121206/20734_1 /TAXON_ID=412157 /ORGANISM="Chrysochromulina rotalis, Strain UIO044" /LENGTH=175 /DNA_ID=CAMNT_0003321975 /DNA_START=24 /DNA_END=551 /DNA_ORIENTATION=+
MRPAAARVYPLCPQPGGKSPHAVSPGITAATTGSRLGVRAPRERGAPLSRLERTVQGRAARGPQHRLHHHSDQKRADKGEVLRRRRTRRPRLRAPESSARRPLRTSEHAVCHDVGVTMVAGDSSSHSLGWGGGLRAAPALQECRRLHESDSGSHAFDRGGGLQATGCAAPAAGRR